MKKTAEEILRDYCINRDYFFSQDDDCEITEVMKIYAKQVAEQALKDAAENAGVITICPVGFGTPVGFECKADKESILNTKIKLP